MNVFVRVDIGLLGNLNHNPLKPIDVVQESVPMVGGVSGSPRNVGSAYGNLDSIMTPTDAFGGPIILPVKKRLRPMIEDYVEDTTDGLGQEVVGRSVSDVQAIVPYHEEATSNASMGNTFGLYLSKIWNFLVRKYVSSS